MTLSFWAIMWALVKLICLTAGFIVIVFFVCEEIYQYCVDKQDKEKGK